LIEELEGDARVKALFREMKRRASRAPPRIKQRIWRMWDRTVLQLAAFLQFAHMREGAPVVPEAVYVVAAEAGLLVAELLSTVALAAAARGADPKEMAESMGEAVHRLFSEEGVDVVLKRLQRSKGRLIGWEEKYCVRRVYPRYPRYRA
jgi:hypothetical protein